jgi:hypothetical protein
MIDESINEEAWQQAMSDLRKYRATIAPPQQNVQSALAQFWQLAEAEELVQYDATASGREVRSERPTPPNPTGQETVTDLIKRGSPQVVTRRLRHLAPHLLKQAGLPESAAMAFVGLVQQQLPAISDAVNKHNQRFRDFLNPLLNEVATQQRLPSPKSLNEVDYLELCAGKGPLIEACRQRDEQTPSFERDFKSFVEHWPLLNEEELGGEAEALTAAFKEQSPADGGLIDLLAPKLINHLTEVARHFRKDFCSDLDVILAV